MVIEKKHIVILVSLFILWSIAICLCTRIFCEINIAGNEKRLENELETQEESYLQLRNEYDAYIEESQTAYNEQALAFEDEKATLNDEINALKEQLKQKEESQAAQSQSNILGMYTTYVRLDDDCVSNLITAVSKLNGAKIEPKAICSFNSICGPYTAQNGYVFIPFNANGSSDGDYSIGVEELSHALYTCALSAKLQISSYGLNNAGMAYVDNSRDLEIQSNLSSNIFVKATYNQGYLEVYLYTK